MSQTLFPSGSVSADNRTPLLASTNLAGLKATPFQLIDVTSQVVDSEVDDR